MGKKEPIPPQRSQLEHVGESLITIAGTNNCLGYLLCHEGSTYDATYGRLPLTEAEAAVHNAALSRAEVAGLDRQCQIGQGGMFYHTKLGNGKLRITTWVGDVVATDVARGRRGFQFVRGERTFCVVRCGRDDDRVFVRRVS